MFTFDIFAYKNFPLSGRFSGKKDLYPMRVCTMECKYVHTYIPVYTLRYVFVCLCVFVSILIVCWFVRVVPGFFLSI